MIIAAEADGTPSLLGHHRGIHGRNGRPVFISKARPLTAMARMGLPETVLEESVIERAVPLVGQ